MRGGSSLGRFRWIDFRGMRTSDFDFELPPDLIAQSGVEPRDHARLLVADRRSGAIDHRRFYDLPDILDPGDLLVVNDSRVIPALLIGRRAGPGESGRVELLLTERRDDGLWECLARPGRRLKAGQRVAIGSGAEALEVTIVEELSDGRRLIDLHDEERALSFGEPPLPPYIKSPPANPDRYQTVYAEDPGSVAAPTAGLHFTPELLERLRRRGIHQTAITLHVGLGTFKSVEVENPRSHQMHAERMFVPPAACRAFAAARNAGKRVVAVGTTAVRVLESVEAGGHITPQQAKTSLLILPGYRFRTIDALITNFHLPKTTLLMLVSAFAGDVFVRDVYETAIRERYRFYSLGDSCIFL